MNSFHENGLKPQDFYSYGTTAHTWVFLLCIELP
jgi:hypothetical protein